MKLNVKEIFYSLQGEGGRSGDPSIFVRLTQCNLTCDFCDTDFANGEDMTLDEILEKITPYPAQWIIWTGGEPTIQLKNEHLAYFKAKGYKQAIETNGTKKVPNLVDYVTCSPKVKYETIKDRIDEVDEIRLAVKAGDVIPDISVFPKATKYFLSPIFDGNCINKTNVDFAVNYALQHPEWSLSLQIHKLINIE